MSVQGFVYLRNINLHNTDDSQMRNKSAEILFVYLLLYSNWKTERITGKLLEFCQFGEVGTPVHEV